jgi:hypothetical protein
MAMLGGTFGYIAVVPDDVDDGLFTCQATCREPVAETGVRHSGDQLVGLAPSLSVRDAGVPPETDKESPWVMRARLTLTATSEERATAAEISFFVDRALTRRMQPGDILHLVRTDCAGLALSIIRQGELIAAVGAITNVPLGDRVKARCPMDLVREATGFYRRRDPEFQFVRHPIEVTMGDVSRILETGPGELGDYKIFVEHGSIPGMPGTDESAVIWRANVCPAVTARSSMTLMATGGASLSHW